jgi:hypothetical protein
LSSSACQKNAMKSVLALAGVAFVLCGACSGGDEKPAATGSEASALYDEQELFWRYECSCEAAVTTLVSADNACVRSNVSLTAAERACREDVLETEWSTAAAYGQCQLDVWRSATTCIKQACDLNSCPNALLALGDCPDLPPTVQTAFAACTP